MARRKKSKKVPLIVGSIIVFLMISSVFGVMFGGYYDQASKIKYGEYTFEAENGKYTTKIDGEYYKFDYSPDFIEDITVEQNALNKLSDSPQMKFAYDYQSDSAKQIALSFFELQNNFLTSKHIVLGSTLPNNFGHQIVNCENATEFIPVLLFQEGDETRLYIEGNCIIGEAVTADEFLVLKDRIAYSILGVME